MGRVSTTWTPEQARAMSARGVAVCRQKAEQRRKLLGDPLRKSVNSLSALDRLIPHAYVTLSKLPITSPQAERLMRTIKIMEEVQRILGKSNADTPTTPSAPSTPDPDSPA